MHHCGINMRYLGVIAKRAEKSTAVEKLCCQEMIVRAAKHIFRFIVAEAEKSKKSFAISFFLNCLFGQVESGSGVSNVNFNQTQKYNAGRSQKSKKQRQRQHRQSEQEVVANGDRTKQDFFQETLNNFVLLSSSFLWQLIVQFIEVHFEFDLPSSWKHLACLDESDKVALLRNFCLKVGIQIAAKHYDLMHSSEPFDVKDILCIFPVVKHIVPETADGHNLLEAGAVLLAEGRMDVGFELLSEALNIFSQIYGPMHQATAVCFRFALVLICSF